MTFREQVIELYVATFNRAPDTTGLNYWVNDSGLTIEQIAQSFFDQPETQAKYPSTLSNEDFINSIYNNLFNRDGDAKGVAYWVEQLDKGSFTKSEAILALSGGALGEDAAILSNKAAVAEAYVNAGLEATDFSLAMITADPTSMQVPLAEIAEDAQDAVDAAANLAINGTVVVEGDSVDASANDGVAQLTGTRDVRIDLTNPDDALEGVDLDNSGAIDTDGVENNSPITLSGVTVVDAYARNPLNTTDAENNFLGDIEFDGTGFSGDGVSTDGNIFLGGLGSDQAFGGIGNDFMTGGQSGGDELHGGRNADFFFVELSELDTVNGDSLQIDGGSTFDDDASQDSDWLLLEASDDDEPVTITLNDNINNATTNDVSARSGVQFDMDDVENVNASGNLYGFLNDLDVELGDRITDSRIADHVVGEENFSIGSSAQLIINGSASDNIVIGGYDNDTIAGNNGDDILFGGDMQFLSTYSNNPNLTDITNDGRDTITGGAGDDEIHFEMDGGSIDGGANTDTLWLTDYSGGLEDTAGDLTEDGIVRIDLGAQAALGGVANSAGHGGADYDADGNAINSADKSNYVDDSLRNTVDNMENIIATGLGDIDYDNDGANEGELDQSIQNYFGMDENLDLRGTNADNVLYANTGDDVLEGRAGDDMLSGGLGNDDFIFDAGSSDGLDVIHRQQDADSDNIWDTDADGNRLYTKDFGDNGEANTSNSSLTLTLNDTANPANELTDIPVEGIVFTLGGTEYTVESTEMGATVTYADFVTELNNALNAHAEASINALTAVLNVDNTCTITDPAGATFTAVGYTWVGNVAPASGDISWNMAVGGPTVEVAQDRLIYTNYEDEADGELIDDDATTGSNVTLGSQSYAQDKVVGFTDEGVKIAESQEYQIEFNNLAVEDTVTVSVNGVSFTLTVGVAKDGTLIAGETTAAFGVRMASEINDALDNDTAAGDLSSAVVATTGADNVTIDISETDYHSEETVFLNTPVVYINSSLADGVEDSNGETATADVTNTTAHEVHLLDVDGRDNELNSENVIFTADTGRDETTGKYKSSDAIDNRAILETADEDGGDLFGSDAIVVNVGAATADDIDSSAAEALESTEISYNTTENLATGEVANFTVHGHDNLISGSGDDNVQAGTGNDRVYGSEGLDTIDGGKDIYLETTATGNQIRVYNTYEALQADATAAVLDLVTIDQLKDGVATTYDDTLIFQQSDLGDKEVGVNGSDVEITLNLDTNQQFGGAGKVVVDGDEANNRTLFTNFENIRTVAGDGTLAGQGNDILDLSVSASPVTGTESANAEDMTYYLDNSVNAGLVKINAANFMVVDGVEHILTGSGDDTLWIDETEAGKHNTFNASTGDDTINYSFDIALNDNFNPAMTLKVNTDLDGNADTTTDIMEMTGAALGLDVAKDELISVENINLTDAPVNPTLNDTLDVTNVVNAVVDFVNGEVRSDSLVQGTNVQVAIGNMAEFEIVNADYADTVIVADTMANTRLANTSADVEFDSFMNYDLVDGSNNRETVADMRANNEANNLIPEANNIGLYQFNMGPDSDTVDYSNVTGTVAAVADFTSTTNINVNNVLVSATDTSVFDNEAGDRVDALTDTENLVASRGNSIIDLTQATGDLKVRFNADDGVTENVAALDRDVFRVQLSELNTTTPVQGMNFLSYEDAGADATVTQTTAEWNTVEGSDNDIMVELTDHETTSNHTFNLRGGDNEVNYNELTRSIDSVISLNTTTNLITVTNTFTDGSGATIGGVDTITNYSAQNAIAAGTLRIEASQDAEDGFAFDPANTDAKAYLLGQEVDGSDQITVTFGDSANSNSMVLTGYERLTDAATDDVYTMDSMDRVFQNLTFTDTAGDNDTIVVDNDAVAFGALGAGTGVASTIDLDLINTAYTMDFDIIDITATTSTGLLLEGSNAGTTDEVYVDNLAAITSIDNFEALVLNNTAVAAGATFTLDIDGATGTLTQGATTVNFISTNAGDANTLSFNGAVLESNQLAGVTTSFDIGSGYGDTVTTAVNVTVTDAGNVGATIIGGSGNDTITTAGGDDIIIGGLGADTLDGGVTAAVPEQQTLTIAPGVLDGNDEFIIYDDAADNTLTVVASGSALAAGIAAGNGVLKAGVASIDEDQIGAMLEAMTTADFETALGYAAGSVASLAYDATANELVITFTADANYANLDVAVGDAGSGATIRGGGAAGAAATATVTAVIGETQAYAAQVDSGDIFGYMSAAESVEGSMDTITNYNFTAALFGAGQADLIDISELGLLVPTFAVTATTPLSDGAAMGTAIIADSDGTDTVVYVDANQDGDYNAGSDMMITLDNYTGAVGLQISAAGGLLLNGTAGADNITGTANADVIIGNGGGDTIDGGDGDDTITVLGDAINAITGGAGDDTINLGAGGFADTLTYGSGTDGVDTVTGFVAGEDLYDTDFVTTGVTYTVTSTAVNTGAALALTDEVSEITGVTAAADMSVIADMMLTISNGVINTNAPGDTSILVVQATDGNSYLYEVNDADNSGVVASTEITYVGSIDADLVNGSII